MSAPLRVLHVDDDPALGSLVADVLERADEEVRVVTETSADAGLDRLASGDQFDCVVSDYDMPGRDGIEFLEAVREDSPDLPFVLFTGKGSEEVASEAILAGATDYLQKGGGSEQYELLLNRVENAVEGYRSRRRATEHERVTRVLRELNRALIRADSIDRIERDVCEILADADPYVAACVAGVDPDTMQVDPRTWANGAETYFEALDMCVAPGSPGRDAPGGRAYHDREVAVSQNVADDPQYEQWRGAATDHGFRSLAVVPLAHEDEFYGLLAVFADRSFAFDEAERDLLSELGDDVAHALHAQAVQAELRTTASRLEALFDRSPDMINVHDAEGTLLDPNPRLCEETGYSEAELTGMKVWDIDQTVDPEAITEVWASMDVGDTRRLEGEFRRKDGSTFPVEIHVRRLDLAGEDRFVVISRDVTERRANKRKRRQIISRMTDAVVEVDADWQITLVNERTEAFADRPVSALLGRNFWEVFADARGTRLEEAYRRAMERRERASLVEYYTGADEWFDIEVYPNDDGGLAFYFHAVPERN